MKYSVFRITSKSASSNMDAIKLERAVMSSFIRLYGLEEIFELASSNKLLFSGNFMRIDGDYGTDDVVVGTNITSLNSIEKRREFLMKRKKGKFLPFKSLDVLLRMYEESGYGPIKINDENIDKFQSLFSELGKGDKPTLELRPGIDFINSEFFIKDLASQSDYFFAVGYEDARVISSLYSLEDFGLSSRRSVGMGQINVFKECDVSAEYEGEGPYLNLSPFIPGEGDLEKINFERSMYSFGIMGGRTRDGIPFEVFRYIRPGSILYLRQRPKGYYVWNETRKYMFKFSGFFIRQFRVIR
ncbi:MAG: hypothetical protein QXQ46_07710 [Thermoplasmatales archaeon]